MIRLRALHHARVAVPDLDACERFCSDFGLVAVRREAQCLYMRGAGSDAYSLVAEAGAATRLLGLAFLVEGDADFANAQALAGSATRELAGPGGGRAVTLADPDGTPIDLVHGIAPVEPLPMRQDLVLNGAAYRPRQGVAQQQPGKGPAQVLRLGHVGLYVTDYAASARWYRETLGFLLSDGVQAGPAKADVVGFYRLDRGEEWVDHHSLALFAGPQGGIQHVSFEVQDFEAQLIAHDHMARNGWQPLWGVGRHGLGSHVFDLWWEPNGLRFETFSDTDLFNAAKPASLFPAGPELTRWGDDMPMEYIHPKGTPGQFGRPPP
jgi:catechol 2,3-dioxygenase-like lactoylglutathione lyase family enzyme